MKAEVINSFELGGFTLTTTTALYARKVYGTWRVHLNYHKVNVRYSDDTQGQEGNFELLEGTGLSVQSTNNVNAISAFSLILGSIGVLQSVINLIRQTLEILSDVSSLLPKVIDWISDEITKVIGGQEPAYLTRLEEAKFVLNLFRDGAYIERRSPKWREKYQEG